MELGKEESEELRSSQQWNASFKKFIEKTPQTTVLKTAKKLPTVREMDRSPPENKFQRNYSTVPGKMEYEGY